VADIPRGPLYVNRRELPPVTAVVFTAGFLLTLAPLLVTLPVGQQQCASAPEIQRVVVDTSHGQPITLQPVVAATPVVVAPHYAPQFQRQQPSDSTRGSSQGLLAGTSRPFQNLQWSAPDRLRPVVDTSQSSYPTTHPFVVVPLPPGGTNFVATASYQFHWQVQNTSLGTPYTLYVPPPPGTGEYAFTFIGV